MRSGGDGAAAIPVSRVRAGLSRDDWLMRAGIVVLGGGLVVAVLLPLWALLSQSFQDKSGRFVGLANYVEYFSSGALVQAAVNSLTVAVLSTVVTVGLAFGYGYALTRSRMPGKAVFRAVALVPLLAPSLLPGIALVYLFGNQGVLKALLGGQSIYGPIGIVLGEIFWTFPHALIIVTTALGLADARLYEAAVSLRASGTRTFLTVTLPGAKYGLISTAFVVFTLVITDFGVPKVIGGRYDVLATDVYKHVVGQQDFRMGAVVGMILLLPAALAFAADRLVRRRQVAQLTARAVPYVPRPHRRRDLAMLGLCSVVGACILGVIGMAAYASFVRLWPYNLQFTLRNYQFDLMDGGSWSAYWNSLEMAGWTAVVGTAVIFTGAWLVEKTRRFGPVRALVQFLCLLPLPVPGLVLGLGYVFFFNAPGNPLGILYQTMPILVVCTIVHFYTVSHLTAVTALKQMDPEFEAVSASLKVPLYRTFGRVTVPVCLPAILDVSVYLFVNAMTTVSAVVFLYSPDTTLASVAVLNMDDAGDVAPAAAMAMMILYTSAAVRVLYALLTRGVARSTQAWRAR